MRDFFLGTHKTGWLTKVAIPLFVSARTLRERKRLPRALGRWAADGGGFTELSMYGRWTVGPRQYAAEVWEWEQRIGHLAFAATQDWMCEPEILARTGLTVEEHQNRTVLSYLRLMTIAPHLPWMPVLQGWRWGDHERCLELYYRNGVDLTKCPIVGVGSICRRQNNLRAALLLKQLAQCGLKLHAFGLRQGALALCHDSVVSTDSLAWSFQARKKRLEGKLTGTNLPNSLDFALQYRAKLLAKFSPQEGV